VRTDRHEEGVSPTLDGSTVGTPAYMSPEQANGELDKIDPRSDIYSLGAILYEILTLERAVEGETPMMLLANAARNRIVPIEKRAAGRHVPRELAAIAMKCLAKTRAGRYRSVLDLRRDIALFLEGRSVSAQPDSFAQSIVKLVKRNKPVSASIAAAAVILLAVTVGFIINLRAERDRARASERQAVADRRAAQKARDDQRATALTASEGLAQAAIRAADEGRFADADFRANAALQVMPDGPWGHYALGAVASEKKDFAAARQHLGEALKLDPSHQPSKAFLALVLAASGNLAEAEKLAAETDRSTDWRAVVAAGDALFAAQRNRSAISAYQRGLAILDKQSGIPEASRAELKDKLAKAAACAKMEGFFASICDLPSEEQEKRLAARVLEAYGNLAGTAWFGVKVRKGISLEVGFGYAKDKVRWLDPLRDIPLTKLDAGGTSVDDLGPLKGMPLVWLNCAGTKVKDLTPLRGMLLAKLDITGTLVSDLAPLQGMPLTDLACGATGIRDLGPLKNMKLKSLSCDRTGVSDLGPLKGMPLESFSCRMSQVSDLEPLRGAPLTWLNCCYTRVSDMTPLMGAPISVLDCYETLVVDLSPLRGMPIKDLNCAHCAVRDLSPLAGMPIELLRFPCRNVATGIGVLRGMKSLKRMNPTGGEPDWMLPEVFWKRYDAGEFR
jgi:tetratricopeptide (TPR) repeat protein